MSEEPAAMTDQHPDSGQPTAGQLLRAAREATGLHIAALAVAMKVPVKKLEALEADRLDELPDAVFVRALAGSMCRALKIDSAPVLSRLPQSALPRFERDDRGINMPYRAPAFHGGSSLKTLVTKPVFLVVAALLIAALAVLLVPDSQSPLRGADTPVSAPVGPLLEVTPSAVKAPEPISAPVPVVVANTPATTPAASAPATMASVPPPARVASAVAASVSAPRPAVGPEVIAFKAKSSAWVRVTDAKGVVQFEKTLAAGEAASVAGSAPFNVVVGNVGATDVSVRGQPFALDAYAKDNVARFEVK
jgi:cytoskeleton protein RodZ